jgi:rod shape determining protein RodA
VTTLAPVETVRRGSSRGRGDLAAALMGIDWILLLAVVALLAFSVYTIDAATAQDIPGDPDYFVVRRLIHIALGTIALVLMFLVDLDRVTSWPWLLLGGLLGALTVVFALGTVVKGSKRWIEIGPLNLQPSELGKVALILILAGIISERSHLVGSMRLTLLATLVTLAPTTIIFLEPDLGTALVYGGILIGMLLVVGQPWQHFALAGGLIALFAIASLWVLPAAGVDVLEPYQVDRLTAFVDSEGDPGDSGYQLDQSETAVGSGGAFGKGVDGATQTINRFLPEHHTDFIFAVVSEMFGFVGSAGVVLLFGVVIWRALRIAGRASSRLDQLVVAGVISMLAFQVFVNIGMTVGIMPITGIPLPFMSFGGSHTIASMAAIGLLLQVHARSRPGMR